MSILLAEGRVVDLRVMPANERVPHCEGLCSQVRPVSPSVMLLH